MTQWGLDNLFNPGKRHMDDEKRRLQSTREEVGDNSGGRRIDLEAGTVSISVPRPNDLTAGVAAESDDALDVALQAEDVPAVALAGDDAEIEPDVVDVGTTTDPVETPASAPSAADSTTRRSGLSATAWSRRG